MWATEKLSVKARRCILSDPYHQVGTRSSPCYYIPEWRSRDHATRQFGARSSPCSFVSHRSRARRQLWVGGLIPIPQNPTEKQRRWPRETTENSNWWVPNWDICVGISAFSSRDRLAHFNWSAFELFNFSPGILRWIWSRWENFPRRKRSSMDSHSQKWL